ncbi:hypothetical protein K438DRAFT_1952284 [Mycena galopus ATCC 62051]|nr:hypothetical protein K438DRAFT_1952284 [Mycena galopus ATCC 62051]
MDPATEASWQADMEELSKITTEWAEGKLISEETVDAEGSERFLSSKMALASSSEAPVRKGEPVVWGSHEWEHERLEMGERLVEIVLELMREPRRREWVGEMRDEDERLEAEWDDLPELILVDEDLLYFYSFASCCISATAACRASACMRLLLVYALPEGRTIQLGEFYKDEIRQISAPASTMPSGRACSNPSSSVLRHLPGGTSGSSPTSLSHGSFFGELKDIFCIGQMSPGHSYQLLPGDQIASCFFPGSVIAQDCFVLSPFPVMSPVRQTKNRSRIPLHVVECVCVARKLHARRVAGAMGVEPVERGGLGLISALGIEAGGMGMGGSAGEPGQLDRLGKY